jgi:hypothetical protein
MRTLLIIFLTMFLYGVVTFQPAGTFISLVAAVLVYYGGKHLDKKHRAALNDPRLAYKPKDTTSLLDKHQCECMCYCSVVDSRSEKSISDLEK